MTDFENSVWSVESSNQIDSRFGGPVNAELFVACRSNKTDVFVNRQQYVTTGGVDNTQPVTYRLGTEQPETEDWLRSAKFDVTGIDASSRMSERDAGGSTTMFVHFRLAGPPRLSDGRALLALRAMGDGRSRDPSARVVRPRPAVPVFLRRAVLADYFEAAAEVRHADSLAPILQGVILGCRSLPNTPLVAPLAAKRNAMNERARRCASS